MSRSAARSSQRLPLLEERQPLLHDRLVRLDGERFLEGVLCPGNLPEAPARQPEKVQVLRLNGRSSRELHEDRLRRRAILILEKSLSERSAIAVVARIGGHHLAHEGDEAPA